MQCDVALAAQQLIRTLPQKRSEVNTTWHFPVTHTFFAMKKSLANSASVVSRTHWLEKNAWKKDAIDKSALLLLFSILPLRMGLPNLTFKLWKEILVLLTLKKRKNYMKFTQPCSCFFEGFRFGWISPWHFGSQLCGAKCVFQHWPISRRWPVCQKLENLARYFFRLSRDPSIK